MREIQTEIRRDRIENDNRKNELQNKGQGGIKTANTHKGEATENTAAENTVAEKHNANSAAEKAQYTRTWDELKPPTSDDFTNIPPSVQNVVDTFKELSEKEASMSKGLEIKGLEDVEKGTVVGITQSVSEKTGQKTIQNQIKHDDIKNSVNRDIIKNKAVSGIKCQKVKAKVANAVKAASAVGAITSEFLQGAVSSEGDGLGSESASEVKKAALEISSKSLNAVKKFSEKKISNLKSSHNPFMKRISDELNAKVKKIRGNIAKKITSSKAAEKVRSIKKRIRNKIHTEKVKAIKKINNTCVVKKVKEIKKKAVSVAIKVKNKVKRVKKRTIRNITKIKHRIIKAVSIRRIFDKSGAFSAQNVKRLRQKISRIKSRKSNRKKRLNKIVAKVKVKVSAFAQKMKSRNATAKKALHKSKGAITNGAAGTIGAVSKIKEISNSNDVGNDLAQLSKDIASKSAELSGRTVKTAIEKPLKTVKNRIKKAEARTVKTSVKRVRKAKRTVKKVKKAKKTAQTTSRAAVKASKAAAKVSEKIVSSIAKAIGSLMSTPAGPIIIAVVCGIVLIVVVFNLISGAIQAPISMVSGVASSLSWLFGGDDSDSYNQEIVDLYNSFYSTALSAMEETRTFYKDQIDEIRFGERDTLEFNEVLYYPASSADEFVEAYFDNLNYDDYPYLMEMCYIKKLRDERVAQGLSDEDIPEVTINRSDILNFLKNYCYEFEITILEGQTCPTADCCEREVTTWCYDDADCPDVTEEGDTCPGHTEIETYCDDSHIKAVVTIKPIPKDVLEDNILVLTEDERNMLETALDVLRDELS